MRVLGAGVLAAMLCGSVGCASTKMVQRDGCWVKRTEKPFKRVYEELGPCVRAPPKWSEDRLTRLVQECVSQADWRWQTRAVEAFSSGRAYPAQPSQEETMRTCMQEARIGALSENEDLKRRIMDLSADKDLLRAGADKERARADEDRTRFQGILDKNLGRLQDSHDRIAGFLGEAAQRVPGPATATASATSTSDGKATNESGSTLSAGSTSGSDSGASAPPVTASVTAPVAPAPTRSSAAPSTASPAAPATAKRSAPPPAARSPKSASLRGSGASACGPCEAKPDTRAAQAPVEPGPHDP